MSCVAKKDAVYWAAPQTATRRAAPNRNPTEWLRFGKEEQGSGADGIFAKKCRSKADFAPTWTVVPKKMYWSI